MTISDNKGNIIHQKRTIKILGYTVNRFNDLENHLSSMTAKITNSFNKIRGALPFMDQRSKKIIIESKLKGQLNLTLPLMLNQTQRVQSRAEVILMKINKWIYGHSVFKKENEKICKWIGNPLPAQEILRVSLKFIHKLLNQEIQTSLHRHIVKPNRITSKYYHRNPKKKLYRTALEHQIALYNQFKPVENKALKPKTFAKKLKSLPIEYTPED